MRAAPLRRPGPLAVLVAVLVAVVVAGAAGVVAHSGPTTWTSTSIVAIDAPKDVAAARDSGVLEKLSRIRYKYAGLVGTDTIATPTAERLKVPAADVRGRLTATALLTDLLLRLSCTERDAAAARRCSDALSASVLDYIRREQVTAGIPAAQRLVVQSVEKAGPALKLGPSRSRTFGLAALAGLVALGSVLLVAARPRP
ncbi:MAG: hypothetical protein JWN87_1240 [Frankiales bacterium]|nr:hypothetical protein [Frankiales bacterium]